MRSLVVFLLLVVIKVFARIFFRFDVEWVGDPPQDRWRNIRFVVFLHHTSLYEPLWIAIAPNHFLWRAASRGVVPAASTTMGRPFVGRFLRMIARDVVPITRQRDETWDDVLARVGTDTMVVLFPEGRMMRRSGLDKDGNPMTVRGGVADVLAAVSGGRMLVAYSGGLHHVQAPGELIPRLFRTLRMRLELVDVAAYSDEIGTELPHDEFRRAVRADLQRRRDEYCPRPDQEAV